MPDDFDPASVPIQPAATVMLVRDAAESSSDVESGLEVFMLRRTAKAAFGAGMYVFPGGRVDLADGGPEIAPHCVGLDDATASRKLSIGDGGLAYWIAAIRECFEEAGVLLASRRNGDPLEPSNDDRHAIHDGEMSLVELCRRDDLVLDLGTTHYVSHWVTPVGERRRFDTRFFVTESPADQEPLHDDKETVDSLWVRPGDALRMHADGELTMMPPTLANLRFLEPHESASAAVSVAATVVDPPRVLPKLRRDDAGTFIGIAMPGDPDYDSLP